MSKATSKKTSTAEAKLKAFHEEESLGKTVDGALLKRLWPFVKPHSRFIVASLSVLVVVTAFGLVRPILMGDVVKSATAGDSGRLFLDGIALSGVVVFTQLLTFLQMYTMQIAGARSMADLREHVFRFFQRLELRYFDRTPVGRLVTRATNDIDSVSELFASGVLNALGDLFSLIGIVVMMLLLDVRLSLFAFCCLPIVGLIVNYVRKRSREAYRHIRTKTARLNAFLNEQVSGIAVVQAYAREHDAAREFDEVNDQYREANKTAIYYEAVLDAAIEMVSTVCVASILYWGGLHHIGDHAVSFPLIVTFTQYIKQFFEPVSLLAQRYTVLQAAMSGTERIFQLLDEKDVLPDVSAENTAMGEHATEAIALDHVHFAYKPNAPVLRDVSLTVNRGEKVALVGATGAGKTTVASLVLRLYEVNEGSVRVFGKDVRDVDRSTLREQFSVVPQDVFLFAGTVLSNIGMTDQTPDRDKAIAALQKIGALDLFMRRPGGIEARVDERGANFSAGEKQLLAFARALYRDAPIVILDEATASIDSDTEAKLQKALEAVMEGRTAIVIAHRLSTIRAVDRVCVFHKGKVVESGTHEALLAENGVYARLYRLQFAHEKAQGTPIAPPAHPVELPTKTA